MGPNLLKYSNGWGHIIMSVVLAIVGLVMVLYPTVDSTTRGIGVGIITSVAGYWFVSSSANIVANNVSNAVHEAIPDPPQAAAADMPKASYPPMPPPVPPVQGA